MLLKEKMFVRCDYDIEYPNDPRDFLYGKIISIDAIEELASVTFYDTNGISSYYGIPNDRKISFNRLIHIELKTGSFVIANEKEHIIKASYLDDKDGYYWYYLISEDNTVVLLSETELIASYNDGKINPVYQLMNYEFQNPIFFFGHLTASKKMQIIENSLYGFNILAGCKIYLKPHQLKTVMRCLSEENCRYMIADEVGLGKTIEAVSVLKIYLSSRKNQKVAIFVPASLIEQWKTELAFKFKLFEGLNVYGHAIEILSINSIKERKLDFFDFIIIDEVHQLLVNDILYSDLLSLSQLAKNIIMLSATPIQKRKSEYFQLLKLIQPTKYLNMDPNHFSKLVDIQYSIIRKIHQALETLDSFIDEVRDSEYVDSDDILDLYEELLESLVQVKKQIDDQTYNEIISDINFNNFNHDIERIQLALAYVCENYQLEKSIIRNRRGNLSEDINLRQLKVISYEMQTEFNNDEFNTYRELLDWIDDNNQIKMNTKTLELIQAFFSSAAAFNNKLNSDFIIFSPPEALIIKSKKWLKREQKTSNNIVDIMDDDVEKKKNRLINVLNFIDQESKMGKVLLFTSFNDTFELYKKTLSDYFGEETCAFYNTNMENDDIEANVYRFQNDKKCIVMLSDQTGGEGRNFQIADMVIHIDIPWKASEIEQRIGRLDRIGRKIDKPVISVVANAEDSIESDIFNLWRIGLRIFEKSQSGLEIVMEEIDAKILRGIQTDFKYGLNRLTDEIVELINDLTITVKQERYFDLASYQYSSMNKMLERSMELFNREENNLFTEAMMSWAAITGFNGTKTTNGIMFSINSISLKSLYKTLFIPPNMKRIIDEKMNKMRNRVRVLTGLKEKNFEDNSIVGTFDRNYAIMNDYIHFFAPGDEIFDSIISNATNSYRGTSTAIKANSRLNWNGIIYFWRLSLDESLVYKNNVSIDLINQYRGYLPTNDLISIFSFSDNEISQDEVINEFKRLQKLDIKNEIIHYGKRSTSHLQVFKNVFPRDKWHNIVSESYKSSFAEIKVKVESIMKPILFNLRLEISNKINTQKTFSLAYMIKDDSDNIKVLMNKIYNVVSSPKIELDSVCYIEMVNRK